MGDIATIKSQFIPQNVCETARFHDSGQLLLPQLHDNGSFLWLTMRSRSCSTFQFRRSGLITGSSCVLPRLRWLKRLGAVPQDHRRVSSWSIIHMIRRVKVFTRPARGHSDIYSPLDPIMRWALWADSTNIRMAIELWFRSNRNIYRLASSPCNSLTSRFSDSLSWDPLASNKQQLIDHTERQRAMKMWPNDSRPINIRINPSKLDICNLPSQSVSQSGDDDLKPILASLLLRLPSYCLDKEENSSHFKWVTVSKSSALGNPI